MGQNLNKISVCIVLMALSSLSCQSVPAVKDPRRVEEFVYRGDVLIRQSKYKEAVAEIGEGLKLEPDSVMLTQQLGRALALDQDFMEAEKVLKRAEKMDPNEPSTHGYFAMMYGNQGKFKEALEYNMKAHLLSPEDDYYYFQIANCASKVGDNETATKFALRYLQFGTEYPLKRILAQWLRKQNKEVPAFESSAVALVMDKKFQEAEKFLQELKDSKKIDQDGNSALSQAYRDISMQGNAREILQEWVKQDPKSAFAKGILGAAFIDFAWQARGTGFISSVTKGAIQAFEERLVEAKRYLQESIKLDKTNLVTVSNLMLVMKATRSAMHEVKPTFETYGAQGPDQFLVQRQMLESLMPKWGGTVNEMLEFSRSQAATSPADSKAPILVALAHWEVSNSYYNGNPEGYFSKKPVWKECKSAFEELVKRFPTSIEVRNMYLKTAYYAGDKEAAKTQYAQIKDQISLRYWDGGYLEFNKVKRGLASN